MIRLDPAGQIREIRFNNRSMEPWRPGRAADGPDPVASAAAYCYGGHHHDP